MNLKTLYTFLAVLAVGVGVGTWVHSTDQKIRSNQEVLDSLERTQQDIKNWMDKKQQEERKREAERKVLEDLCRKGRLPPEDCP
jgi:hypothetical protein